MAALTVGFVSASVFIGSYSYQYLAWTSQTLDHELSAELSFAHILKSSFSFFRRMGFDGHGFLHSFAKRCGFPVSEEHAAGDFDSLTVDPEIIVRQQGRDRAADIVGQPDAPKGNLRSDEFVDLLVVT